MTSGSHDQSYYDREFLLITGSEPTTLPRNNATGINPTKLPSQTAQFLEYFREIFPAFNADVYGQQLGEELETDDNTSVLHAYVHQILSQFASINYEGLTEFGTLEKIAQKKQLMSAEYNYVFEDSLWLRRMIDLACPVGPEVSCVEPDEVDQFIYMTYGRPISHLVVFHGVRDTVYKQLESTLWEELKQLFSIRNEAFGLMEYIINVGALQGLRRWEGEFVLEDTPERETARERMDRRMFADEDEKCAVIARQLGVAREVLTERFEGLLETVRDYTFTGLERMYGQNVSDDEE